MASLFPLRGIAAVACQEQGEGNGLPQESATGKRIIRREFQTHTKAYKDSVCFPFPSKWNPSPGGGQSWVPCQDRLLFVFITSQ